MPVMPFLSAWVLLERSDGAVSRVGDDRSLFEWPNELLKQAKGN